MLRLFPFNFRGRWDSLVLCVGVTLTWCGLFCSVLEAPNVHDGELCVPLPATVVISYCKPSSNTSQLFEQPDYQTFYILLETSNLETTQPTTELTPANLATRSFTGKPDWRLKLTVVFQWGVFPRNPHFGSEDPTGKAWAVTTRRQVVRQLFNRHSQQLANIPRI